MAGQRTDEVSSLFNSLPPSNWSKRRKLSVEESDNDESASDYSGSDQKPVTVYHPPTTDSSSWNFAPEENSEEMRRLRSESAAQRQKAVATERQARETNKATNSPVKGKGKAKTIVESEDEEEEMSVSEEEDIGADEEGEVDVDGELSEDEIKAASAGEVDSEDDDVSHSPLKPRLKIKLKLPIVPASSTSNTATPVPEEEKMTPGRRTVSKRSAAVRGRRRIQEIESSSSEVESEDGESDLVDEEEDEEDGDLQVNADNPSAVRTTKSGSKSRSMTTRQAVLASVMDSSHIALDSDLAAQSIQGNTSKKKKVLNETELALRREENARKRKNLSEKRLEDEKLETINRLLKKQTRPRAKRAGGPSQVHSTGSSVPPPPIISNNKGGKRGGARASGRARGGRKSRPRAGDEEGGEAEAEGEGDAMEVDGQEGENEEGMEGENEVEGDDGATAEGSPGGSDLSKPAQGPVVPMFRWVSTTVLVPVGPDVSAETHSAQTVPRPEKVTNIGDGDIHDVDFKPHPSVGMWETSEAKTVTDIPTAPMDQSAPSMTVDNPPILERRMQFSLSIPAAFLPSEVETNFTPSSPDPAPAICAVSGCGDLRKYRLVKDWRIGACGMAHLKVLESMT